MSTDLKKIKSKLDDFVYNSMEAIEASEQYKKAVEYKFELSLILFAGAGSLMETVLYIYSLSPWWGLTWLLPIYGVHKIQLKAMQKPINS